MALKLLVISAVLLFFPPIVWFLTRKYKSFPLRTVLFAMWITAIFVAYPAVSFTWAVLNVDGAYDSDCVRAAQLARRYMKLPYFQLQIDVIGRLAGATPKYYYLNTIGVCEFKTGRISEAVKAFEELEAYCLTSPYDRNQLEMTSKVLQRLKQRVKEDALQQQDRSIVGGKIIH